MIRPGIQFPISYKDIVSDTCYVKFPVKKAPVAFDGASVVIWTTTPWTLPGNRAIAYGEDLTYICYPVTPAVTREP
jgi:isoleucyl-tRNA synthetase